MLLALGDEMIMVTNVVMQINDTVQIDNIVQCKSNFNELICASYYTKVVNACWVGKSRKERALFSLEYSSTT